MKRRVNVIGVGMTKFAKPGASPDYHEMAKEAGTLALADAGIAYGEVEQAFAGYLGIRSIQKQVVCCFHIPSHEKPSTRMNGVLGAACFQAVVLPATPSLTPCNAGSVGMAVVQSTSTACSLLGVLGGSIAVDLLSGVTGCALGLATAMQSLAYLSLAGC